MAIKEVLLPHLGESVTEASVVGSSTWRQSKEIPTTYGSGF